MSAAMRADAEQYLAHLQALLPSGPAWPREPEAVLTKVLAAEADGLARAHNRTADLVDEADPRSARELLGDWERVAGLPDPCSAGIATTLQERRAAVVTRLTATGGQSIVYFTGIAAGLGYQVTIDEFRPFVCGRSRCGDRLNGPHSVRHTWRVRVGEPRVTLFRAGASQAGDRLGKFTRAEDLECLLRRLKPQHTTLIVSYEGT
jgi:uncharacterized protein YmfQ (DUF2313 family)